MVEPKTKTKTKDLRRKNVLTSSAFANQSELNSLIWQSPYRKTYNRHKSRGHQGLHKTVLWQLRKPKHNMEGNAK